MAQLVKNPPATWEIWIQSLGWEDPLEKGKIPWGGKELDTAEQLSLSFAFTDFIVLSKSAVIGK